MEQVRCESKSEIESIFVRLEMTQNGFTYLNPFVSAKKLTKPSSSGAVHLSCAHTHNHNRSTHLTQSQGRSREVLQSRYKIRYIKRGASSNISMVSLFSFFPFPPPPPTLHPPPPFLGKFVENFLHDVTMDHHYLLHSHL